MLYIETKKIILWLLCSSYLLEDTHIYSLSYVQVRQISEMINSGTQPVQNLSVLNYYSSEPKKKAEWAKHFIENGLRGNKNNYRLIQLVINDMNIICFIYWGD